MNFIYGDFNDHHKDLVKHDIVTLEKVVCCYPHINDLLENSLSKADKIYGLVYPVDNFISRTLNICSTFYFKIKGSQFQTFVHSEAMMHEKILSKGFERVFYKSTFPWHVAVYKNVIKLV